MVYIQPSPRYSSLPGTYVCVGGTARAFADGNKVQAVMPDKTATVKGIGLQQLYPLQFNAHDRPEEVPASDIPRIIEVLQEALDGKHPITLDSDLIPPNMKWAKDMVQEAIRKINLWSASKSS